MKFFIIIYGLIGIGKLDVSVFYLVLVFVVDYCFIIVCCWVGYLF